MATTILARGQITIVDLNDARTAAVSIQNSGADSQFYDSDNNLYNPGYTDSPITLTPYITVAGETGNQIASCGATLKWEINDGSTYTLDKDNLTKDNGSYSMDSKGVLTIKKNLATNFLVCKFSCTYTDGENGMTHECMAEKTINRVAAGSALFSAVITTPKGRMFDTTQNSQSLTAVCSAKRGAKDCTTKCTFAWYYLDITSASTDPWKSVSGVSGLTVSDSETSSTLTVTADAVLNAQHFKCVAKNGEEEAEDYVLFEDVTDPYTVELYAPTGDKILNGQGNSTVYAKLWQGTTLIEDGTQTSLANQKYKYTWTKLNASGSPTNWTTGDTTATYDSSDGTKKSGNPITVFANDVQSKVTLYCEVTKK